MPPNAAFFVGGKGSRGTPSILFPPAVSAAIIPALKAHKSLATTIARGESVYGNSLTPSKLFGIALLLFCVSGLLIWVSCLRDSQTPAFDPSGVHCEWNDHSGGDHVFWPIPAPRE
jgi:uncharacterized membrane protein